MLTACSREQQRDIDEKAGLEDKEEVEATWRQARR